MSNVETLNQTERELAHFDVRRKQLIDMIATEKARLKTANAEIRQYIQRSIYLLQEELEELEKAEQNKDKLTEIANDRMKAEGSPPLPEEKEI